MNTKSIGNVRIFGNAKYRRVSYNLIVLDWYLSDWLKTLQVSQADLVRETGYPKAKVSDLVTGKQRYNRDILNDIASALKITPPELLKHPEDAMADRRMKKVLQDFVELPRIGTAVDLPHEKPEKSERHKAS